MNRLIIFIIFVLSAFHCTAQDFSEFNIDNVPATLKSRANAIIRKSETTVDMRAPDNVLFTVKKIVTVLNKNGDNQAALALYYNKNTSLKSVKGYMIDAGGNLSGKFSLNNFIDESAVSDISLFEDDRVKHYNPSVLSYPYTISYEYEVRFKQNLIIPNWYANPAPDVAVQDASYTFLCKPGEKIRIKEYNYKGKPEETKTEKLTNYTWRVSQLSAFKQEPYSPDPDSYRTYVKVAAEQFTYYGHTGNYNDWKGLGKWVYHDLIKSRQTLSNITISNINELVKGITSEKEKARKIYEYLQKKTRYISVQVGIGGFQPFAASEVDQLSYGDCKALVNYMQTLLKNVNIDSYYCLVSAGSMKKNFDINFASMDQGNHIILCIPFENDTTWLECTSQDTPFGYLGTFTDDRYVLACTPEGGKILKTPALNAQANALRREAELHLHADGNVSGNMTTTLKGSQYDNYDRLVNRPYQEQLKLLKEEYDIDNIDFNGFKLVQDKGKEPVTTEKLSIDIRKYAPANNNHVYLTPNLFNKARQVPEVRNRTLPVYINRGYIDEDILTFNIPDGYVIEAKPEDVAIEFPFGTYSISSKLEGKKLIYRRLMKLNSGTFPAEEYLKFANFFNTASSNDNRKVVFRTN